MPPITGIKSSFAGGEFAPSLYSRVDLAKYSTGARKLRNLIVHPHGGISNRPGLKYTATGKTAGKEIRLIPFEFSTTQTYMIESGEYYKRFFTSGAPITQSEYSLDTYTKALLHMNGADQSTVFTEENGKAVTNAFDAYTKLLLHMDGVDAATTFTDEIGKAVTAVGNAQIDTAQKKFGTASGLFDGTGDYLSLADSADWDFGTGDFTIDFGVRFNALPTAGEQFALVYDGADGTDYWQFQYRNGGTFRFTQEVTGGANNITYNVSYTPATNTWYHIALVRSGNSWYVFIDGVQAGATGTFTKTLGNFGGNLFIGAQRPDSPGLFFNGWIDEFRISKGIARWTANFTPPTSAYNLAYQVTAQQKLGTASGYFDGLGAKLSLANSTDFNLGLGDFSVESFIRIGVLGDMWLCGNGALTSGGWGLKYDNTAKTLAFWANNGSRATVAFNPTIDTWYHIAVARYSATITVYADGVAGAGSIYASSISSVYALTLGADSQIDSSYFNGWMDEFRLSLGVARWIAGFTPPTSANIPYEITTPYSEADLALLNYTQSADVLYLAHPDYAPRQLARLANDNWALSLYDFTNGPFQIPNVDTTKTLAISVVSGTGRTLTASGFTFNSLHVSSLWELQHYIEGQAVTAALASVATTSSITCGGTWRMITHGTWTATIRIQKSTDGGSTWTMLREFSSVADFNANTFGTEDMSDNAVPFLIRVSMTAFTSGSCNVNLTSDPFYQKGICKITAVAAGGVTATVDVKRVFGLTTATIDWAEGSWSDYRGWPAVVEFHPEDRLIFANTYNEPQTYWMTQTGNYTNFAKGNPLVDSDSISSPLPSRKVNGINGLIALTEMIALTLSNEVSIRSDSGPLTPTSAFNRVQGYEGSYGIRPLVIGNRAIYVQSTGSVIRDLGFDLGEDAFKGADLTMISNHLFNGYTITEMAYQQNPDRLVWAIRSDGKLLSMTYMREQEVIAWSWHDTNEGTDLFESVAVIRGDGYDEAWFSVNRGGTRYIERMVKRLESTASEDQFFVDCGKTYDSTPATVITGLSHLEGKAVAVLADGVVIAGKTVSGNQITLAVAASVVQVGLAYKSDLETLNIDADLPDGSAQGRKSLVARLILRLLNTRGLSLGPDENTLYAQSIGSASALYSGDHPATVGGGYTGGGRIFVRQSDPLPVTITGIMPEASIGGFTQT